MLVACLSARADAVYAYTGQFFTEINNTYPAGRYNTSTRITGSVTFAAPLASDLSAVYVLPTAFYLTDGTQFVSNGQILSGGFGPFSTDTQGNITAYSFGGDTEAGNGYISISNLGDASAQFSAVGQSKAPGSFVLTPEPSSFALLGTGLLGVAGAIKRRYA